MVNLMRLKIQSSELPKLAIKQTSENNSRESINPIWAKISGFLSLKSENTQNTYLPIVHEWCRFLGAEAGSAKAAELMIKAATDHAIGYKRWLEKRPGEIPRLKRSSLRSNTSALLSERVNQKRDGLQNTLSNATIAKKLAALRRIYRVLISAKLGITDNPFDIDNLPSPASRSGQKRPTEMVDFALVKKIVELPDRTTPKGLRDRTILSVLFGAGLRRSEVLNLRLGDVRKTPSGTVFVHLRATKAKRDADQVLPDWAAKDVEQLIQIRLEQGAYPADYLFVSYRGKGGKVLTKEKLSDNGLYRLFKHYCILAGAGEFLSPHSARATAITKLLSDGVSHREVQEFSRHSSVQMVELYDKRRIGVEDNPGKKLEYK